MARVVRLEATGPHKIEPGTLPADKPTFMLAFKKTPCKSGRSIA